MAAYEYMPRSYVQFYMALSSSNRKPFENDYEHLVMVELERILNQNLNKGCLLYTSPSPRDLSTSRMPSSA